MAKHLVANGGLDRTLSKLRRELTDAGVMSELRRRAHFTGPSEARRHKSVLARKRARRAARRINHEEF